MKNKKILILEDDLFLVKIMQKKFEKAGNEVQILTDGTNAVTIAKEFSPDVIIVDLIMPETDGFTAIQNLKNEPTTKEIPIIVASNLNSKEDITNVTNLGIIKYFVKSDTNINEIVNFVGNV